MILISAVSITGTAATFGTHFFNGCGYRLVRPTALARIGARMVMIADVSMARTAAYFAARLDRLFLRLVRPLGVVRMIMVMAASVATTAA